MGDHKIIVLALTDPLAATVNNIADLKAARPDVVPKLVDWLKMYKTTDGKPENKLSSDEPTSKEQAEKVVTECHAGGRSFGWTAQSQTQAFGCHRSSASTSQK